MKHYFEPATQQTEQLQEYEALRMGAFVHFNMQQFFYTESEFTTESNPAYWNPSKLDVEQWFRKWSLAGIKYATLCLKHTSDFCLWDTKTSDKNVMHSPVPVDIFAQFVKYAKKYNIKPCFYYCIWGGEYNPNPNAKAIMLAQLSELLENYGDIFMIWLDMANWRPSDLTVQELYDFIKSKQPNCLVHYNQHIQDGSKIAYFPTDLLNGEERIPPEGGHEKLRAVNGKKYYLPFEYEICLQQVDQDVGKGYTKGTRWFTYSEGIEGVTPSHPAPMAQLYPFIHDALQRGASNVSISTAPDYTGLVRECDIAALCRIRDAIDANANSVATDSSAIESFTLLSSDVIKSETCEMHFTIKTDCTVTSLGRYAHRNNTASHELSLYSRKGEKLCSTVVQSDSPCDLLCFKYAECDKPVALKANTAYILRSNENNEERYSQFKINTTPNIEINNNDAALLNLVLTL